MDKIKSSVAAKVMALVLALLLIISIVPVNGLTNNLRNSASAAVTNSATQATTDEAKDNTVKDDTEKNKTLVPDETVTTENVISDYVTLSVKSGAAKKIKNADYYSKPQEFKFTYSGNGNNITDYSVYLIKNEKVSVDKNKYFVTSDEAKQYLTIDLKDIEDGKYRLSVEKSENDVLFYYDFIVDSTVPTLDFKYDKEYSKDFIEVSVYPKDYAGVNEYAGINFDSAVVRNESNGLVKSVRKSENGVKYLTFSAETAGQYTIEISDYLGNKAEIKTQKIIIDKTAPAIKILPNKSDPSYSKSKWTNDDVKVAFSVDDGEDSSEIDLKNIKVTSNVTGKQYDVKKDTTGVYYFIADTYGKYTIEATDNVGFIGKAESKTIFIDKNTTSTIEAWFNKSSGILNFLTFGIYENNDIEASVKFYNDYNESSIKEAKLYINDKYCIDATQSFKGKDDNGSFLQKKFILKNNEDTKDKSFKLSFYVEDEAGNKENIPITNKIVKVYVDGAIKKINPKLFEVVFSEAKPEIGTVNVNAEKYVNNEENYIYSGAITFDSEVKDDLSGLKEVKLYFDKASEIETDEDGNIINLSELTLVNPANQIDISKTEKTTAIDDLRYITANKLATGEYTFVIAATNNNGNTSIKSTSVLVDSTQPQITKFEYSAEDTDNLKLVDGKLYCDKPVTVKVYADDSNIDGKTVVSSGLSYIKLYNGNEEITATSEFDTENGCKTFKLPISENAYNLSAKAIDKLGNGSEAGAPKTTAKSLKKLDLNNAILDIDDTFEIVVNNEKTNIKHSGFEFNGFRYRDKNAVYSGDGTVSTTITDKLSGVSKVTVKVNDENVDGYCTVTDAEKGKNVTFDTKKYNSDGIPSGKYTLKVTAENNCGIENSFVTTFYIDKTAPKLSRVDFDLKSGSQLKYGIYSNKGITMKVTVDNGENSSPIKSVTIVDKYDHSVTSTVNSPDSNTVEFEIPENKLNIGLQVVACDDVGNESTTPIANDGVTVTVNSVESAVEVAKDFEVVYQLKTPELENDEIKVDFADKSLAEKDIYKGQGTFSAKVKERLSGLKDIKLYFDKKDKFVFGENNTITNLSALTPVEKYEGISKESKTGSTEVIYTTSDNLTTGEYTFVIAATNNSGNTLIKSKTIGIDATNPIITNFEYSAKDTDNLKLVDGKLYCDKPVTVKVYADDLNIGGKTVVSSGIDDIILYNGDKEITATSEFNSENGCKTFELPTSENAYNLSAIAIDKLGNGSEADAPKTTAKSLKKLTLKDEILDIDDTFYIVVNNNPSNIIDSGFEFNGFSYSNGNAVYSGDGTVSTTITDKLSDISKIVVTVNDVNVDDCCDVTDVEKGQKVVFDTKKYNSNGIPSGEYTLKVTAENNCGIKNSFETTFYVDKIAPENISFEFSKTQIAADQILSFLTFGIYSNNNVDVKVTAVDNAPSSGIADIKLSSSSKLEIIDEGRIKYTNTSPEKCTYSKTFTLKADEANFSEEKSFYNDLTATATDNLKNTSSKNYNTTENQEIVITKNAPTIIAEEGNIVHSFDNSVEGYKDETGYWFEGDVKFRFDVKDKYSKLSSVQLMLNGTDVTEYCTDTASATPGRYTEIDTVDATGKEVSATTISIDTTNIPDGILAKGENKFTIIATGNNGEESRKTITFFEKNEAPEITKFEFKKSIGGQILSFLTFGIYSNNNVDVKVTAVDNAPSSGIADIKLSSSSKLEIIDEGRIKYTNTSPEKCTYSKTFTLKADEANFSEEKSFYNDLTATATDNLKNTSSKNYNTTENQEIVITKNAPEISTSFENLLDSDSAKWISKYYDEEHNNYWFAGNVKFSFDVKDDYSKLSSVHLMLNGTDITEYCTDTASAIPGKYTDTDKVDVNGKKVSATTISIDTANIPDGILAKGENKFTIIATGNNGVICDESEVKFFVDTDEVKAENISFEFSKTQTAADQILSFLTFGIYSNNDVDVKVTAVDNAPSSGIADIELSKSSGLEIVHEGRIDDKNTSPEECTYVKTFTLKVDEAEFSQSESFYENLIATVTDKVGNKGSSNYNKDGNPEIVITKKAPEISTSFENLLDSDSTKWTSKYYDDEKGNYWFAGDVKFSFDVKDEYSKLSSVNVKLNGKDITEYCKDTESRVPIYTKTDTVDKSGTKVSSTTISVDTANIPNVNLNEGENKFTITATGNNGVTCEESEVKSFVDTTIPKVDDFKFEPAGNMDEKTTPVETTDYGYYFRNDVNVTVLASDGKGSGIGGSNNQVSSKIYYKCVDVDGNETNGTVLPGESFTVKKDFKGQIYAYAIDNVGNKGSEQHPYGSIVESEQKHRESSNIDLETIANVVNKDDANRDIYNNDVKITIALKDSYSGIRTVHYRIYDDYGDNIENTFSIDRSGNFSDGYSWSYIKDKNLVTELKTTIPVSFNSNNIRGYVEFIDRAGHKETEDIVPFSIDKTAPTIKVVYDNNDFKTYQGDKYFKADRTATITVTERNFNENDFSLDINSVHGTNVGIDGWTHNYNSADPDASTHVMHIRFTSDDDYKVDMSFKDMAQNRAQSPAQEKFTLDKTQPKISVSFDNNSVLNGNYYKAERTATITIIEHNFAADSEHLDIKISAFGEDNTTPVSAPNIVGWSSNGDTRTATVTFANDGKFEFTVDYKDLAYNAAQQEKVDTFYVDKTNPEIKFEDVKSNSAYANTISPVVIFTDNNYDGYTSLTLERIDINKKSDLVDMSKSSVLNGVTGETVTYGNFENIEENDGIYKLSAKMVDKAGNDDSKEILFSVNRFGSTYMAGDESTDLLIGSGYSNAEKDILIKEINVNKVLKQSISLSCNNSKISDLKLNENYTISGNGGSNSWYEYTYKINKDNFVDEGYYTITLLSTDSVKHTVSNIKAMTKERKCPVSFTIDKTAPQVRIFGVENNYPYEEASRQVRVICEDVNISTESMTIELNGKKLKADKDYELSEENAGEITAKFKVEAIGDDTKQNIKVSIVDKAGNKGNSSVNDFILSASFLTRFFANTPLVIASFAVLAVVIGLILFFVVRKRKKDEES